MNHRGPLPLRELHSTDDTIVWRDPGGSWACLRPVSDYEWIPPSRGCRWHRHTRMWRLCEAGRFSYGVSPRTPPLEGTSLHRRHNRYSVERPWGILSLFTTRFRLRVNSPFQRLWHRHTCMWRLCKAGRFSYGESPWTPPLEGTSLHRWNNSVERPWGILSLFTTRFRLRVNSPFQRLWYRHTCMWRLCKAGRFSYGGSPWTPPLEGTSLHRWNNSVERPWGILSLFTTRFRLRVNSPFQRPLVTQT